MTKLEKILTGAVIGVTALYATAMVKTRRQYKMQLSNDEQLLEKMQGVENVIDNAKKVFSEES